MSAGLDASLPRQPQHVAAVLTGLREPRGPWGEGRRSEAADAFEAVRIVARASGIDVKLRAAQHLPWHPGRCAEVLVGETVVGHAGQLHPAVIERSGLPKGTFKVKLAIKLSDGATLTQTRTYKTCAPKKKKAGRR